MMGTVSCLCIRLLNAMVLQLAVNEMANIINSICANMQEGCGLIQERSYLVLFAALPFHLTTFFLQP